MSETATDLKAEIVKLAKDIDETVARAEKAKLTKTVKAVTPLKADMLKAVKLDFKAATVEFYRKKLDTIHQAEAAEKKQAEAADKKLADEITKLSAEIDKAYKSAVAAKAPSGSKRLETIKKDFSAEIAAHRADETVEKFSDLLDTVKDDLDREISKLSKGSAAPAETWTVADGRAEKNEIESAHKKKYDDWKKAILKGTHPKEAAESIGDSHYETVGAGYTIRLSKEHRVFFTISGTSVTVKQIGGHYPKTKK